MIDNTTRVKSRFRLVLPIVLALAALFLLYFYRLGSYPLVDPDEPVYGQVAREMASGHGWLTSHYLGKDWFDKPPMFYWLSGISALAFGPIELAVRLPSALLAVGLVLLVYLLASHDFGRRAGLFSAVVMATCLQQIVLARAAVTDMTFAFFLTASLYFYRRWFDALCGRRVGWAVVCGIAGGLAMLTKGPVAPLLLAVAFTAHLAWTKQLNRLRSADALAAVAALVLVGLPWYIAMYALHYGEFVRGFLVANNVTRFVKAEHRTQTGGWYSILMNVPILAAFFFPWSAMLPQAIARFWRTNDGARLAAVWLGVVFVFFSISKTILVTYIFPLYPAAAVFVGTLLASASCKTCPESRSVRAGANASLVLAVVIAAAVVLAARHKFPQAMAAGCVLGAILILSTAAARLLHGRTIGATGPTVAMGVGMVAFAFWLLFAVIPIASPWISTRALLAQAGVSPGAEYLELEAQKPSLEFYLDRPVLSGREVPDVRHKLEGRSPVAVVCRQTAIEELRVKGSSVRARSGDLAVVSNVGKKPPKVERQL